MAKRKKVKDDDVIIDEIENELDAATEKALARAADTVCKECMQNQRKANI